MHSRKRDFALLLCAAAMTTMTTGGCKDKTPAGPPGGDLVIQYDCIPNYANWGGVTSLYKKRSGVTVPPDPKGSSVALAAIEKEKDAPRADCAYYSGAIGVAAARKGLHQPYKPAGWDQIPVGLKDPEGLWWTIHTATLSLIVNTQALAKAPGHPPVPATWDDLLKPEYRGQVTYDDPTWGGTGYTFLYGINVLKGGDGSNFKPGLEYLKKLDANVTRYPRESIYNEVLRGEVAIWINADGNGYKMKWIDKGPVEVVIPSDGTVSMPLVMGMVKGAPHAAATRRYFDWLLTSEAQAEFARAFFRPIVAGTLPADLKDKFLPDAAYAHVTNLPLSEMAAHSDALKQAWLAEIGHRR
ncbi:MAG TPA: extracellular solute-binding protein [Polyangia bacterium]|jgi:putative spermidine/putrescine transport system substrate-binding protein|nr:extracellular solute-binding protein [Polyangia bacterium]